MDDLPKFVYIYTLLTVGNYKVFNIYEIEQKYTIIVDDTYLTYKYIIRYTTKIRRREKDVLNEKKYKN